jgi:hypothetical protein
MEPGTVNDEPDDWTDRIGALSAGWRLLVAAERQAERLVVPQWRHRVEEMLAHQARLKADGHWRGGPRTLLGALDLQYRELAMTGGLAWLLRPDGHHGLGGEVLRTLLERVGVQGADVGPRVRVVVEESRDDTRADLVVYGDVWTVVIEAKVFAVEQDENWSGEPCALFVFLTRGQRIPRTCVRSPDAWIPLTWSEVARYVSNAADALPHASAGVHEYIATLEAYHSV